MGDKIDSKRGASAVGTIVAEATATGSPATMIVVPAGIKVVTATSISSHITITYHLLYLFVFQWKQ